MTRLKNSTEARMIAALGLGLMGLLCMFCIFGSGVVVIGNLVGMIFGAPGATWGGAVRYLFEGVLFYLGYRVSIEACDRVRLDSDTAV